VLNDKSIDAQSRAIIRYALGTNDPWLAELVRRADMGDTTEQLDFSQMPENNEDDSSDAKIKACVELICNAGSKASVALLVLMATLEKATHPKALANVAKHLVGLCLKSRTSLLDTVSTTRGSGWVAHQTCDFANGFELVCLTHPLPRVVLTVSKLEQRLLRQGPSRVYLLCGSKCQRHG
jgi:hypothetical protein